MDLGEVRTKYLEFFKARGHTVIPSASLVPENDPTTLFTGSGMQPLVPYLLGTPHPSGARLTDSQKCFRSMDIEEVGDNRHTTFFEMLGNWSLGEYFKEKQIPWMFTFLVDELGLNAEHLYITCFIGAPEYGIPKDSEAAELWQKLFQEKGIRADIADINTEADGYKRGMKESERIFYYEGKKNWWNRGKTGPETTPVGDPCGPDSEMFYEFTDIEHDTAFGEHCHPNCDCGRFMEIGNNVFMAYRKVAEGEFVPLEKRNIDHGSGLERIAAAVANSSDVFPITHAPIIEYLERISGKSYADDKRSFRIIADHMKAAVFLIADGVHPSNTDQGYFVRRLIRRSVRFADMLGITEKGLDNVVEPIIEMYKDAYPELVAKQDHIRHAIEEEESRFRTTLARGLREFEKMQSDIISGTDAFMLFSTYGFPFEITLELAHERGKKVDEEGFKAEMHKHQDLSRSGSEQKFKGGLADHGEITTMLHTCTHLMLAGLRKYLGDGVHQAGSNITAERTRFDFTYPEKVPRETLDKVEAYVNEAIQKKCPVTITLTEKEKAKADGVEGSFWEKYPDMVNVYAVACDDGTVYSQELCGGPHVENTGAIKGTFKITKEEASSAGVRRIKAILQ
jgi:alanyl-tRNA synthetase